MDLYFRNALQKMILDISLHWLQILVNYWVEELVSVTLFVSEINLHLLL